jgi:hypothetical protein
VLSSSPFKKNGLCWVLVLLGNFKFLKKEPWY